MKKEQYIEKFHLLEHLYQQHISQKSIDISGAYNHQTLSTEKSTYDFNNIRFHQGNVVEEILSHPNCGVLIFASAKNPGGGVTRGSIAQDEAISYHSTWYFQAKENQEFYLEKGANALNSDNISVAKGYMLTDLYHNPILPQEVTFIACAAPNKKGLIQQGYTIKDEVIYGHLHERIKKILITAQNLKVSHLILGAFGCGVFGLESSKVAEIFKENISEGYFKGSISFSIMDKDLLNNFQNILSCSSNNFKNMRKKQ